MKRKLSFLTAILSISFLFLSCEDTTPILGSVKSMVLIDNINDTISSERLAVYVELKSDPLRIKELSIRSQETGYTWTITKPFYIKDKEKNVTWVGSSNFLNSQQLPLPRGSYALTYTDLAERSEQLYFSLDYDLDLIDTQNNESNTKNIAIYDESNFLLYYGIELDSTLDIKEQYPQAKYMRTIYTSKDLKTAVLEPLVQLQDGE